MGGVERYSRVVGCVRISNAEHMDDLHAQGLDRSRFQTLDRAPTTGRSASNAASAHSLTFPPIARITPAFRRNFVRALYRDDPVIS